MTAEKDTKVQKLHPEPVLSTTDIAQLASGLESLTLDRAQRGELKQRVLQAAFAVTEPANQVIKAGAGTWADLLPGVKVKALRIDRALCSQTSLWQLAPGACLPEHDHSAEEECLVVAGTVEWAGNIYEEGDYLRVGAGFHHTQMRSPSGAILLIRGELSPRLEQAFVAPA